MHELKHAKALVNGVRLHYVTAGTGEPLVLLHGFPETWVQWRKLIPALAERYTVIAPDYRGAGASDRPKDGYDKQTMAADIRELVDLICPGQKFSVVGHDMGSFVAFALAAAYAPDVRELVLLDAPVLGTTAWDQLTANPKVWHIGFHGARDVAELLVTGHERAYLTQFFDSRAYHTHLVHEELDLYVREYSAPGALRAAFEAYRALPQDADANRELLKTFRLPMPVLVVSGALSNSAGILEAMGAEVATDYRFAEIAESGHWLSEEQPERLLELLLDFLA